MEGITGAVKHILIGENEDAPHFIMRYFELAPGGHSRLENAPAGARSDRFARQRHGADGGETYDVEPFDVVFIEGGALHQFI